MVRKYPRRNLAAKMVFAIAALICVNLISLLNAASIRVYHDATSCDNTVKGWRKGRTGAISLDVDSESELTIKLSQKVSKFKPYCLKMVSENEDEYVMKMKRWCGRGNNMKYIMKYLERDNPAKIVSVKVDGVEVCLPAVPAPDPIAMFGETCTKFNNFNTIGTGLIQGILEIPIKHNHGNWKIKIGMSPMAENLQIINANQKKVGACSIEYRNFPNQKRLKAGSTLKLNYNLNVDLTKSEAPVITYISISSRRFTESCGVKPDCPEPTKRPRRTRPLRPTKQPNATKKPRPEKIAGQLSGRCGDFVNAKNTWGNGQSGSIKFNPTKAAQSWKILVGFSEPVRGLTISEASQMNQVGSSGSCRFAFKSYQHNGELTPSSALELNYNFYYQENGQREITFVKIFYDGKSGESCGKPPMCGKPRTTKAPVTDKPITVDPEIPITVEPEVPITVEPEIPITIEPEVPITVEPELPITVEPEVPITVEPELPITVEPEVPITVDPELPITVEPEVPITVEPEVPITVEPEVPVTAEPELPITVEPEVPVTAEPEIPITVEPEVPITVEPEVPVTAEPEIPITAEPEVPVTVEPELLTTAEPELPITTEQPEETTTESPACTPKYDYSEAIHDSLLFYEAQRSGDLPESNRVPWRKDSFVNDGQTVGLDLSGGYFDAGDYVKFNFPAAATMTMLAWGMIEFEEGYKFSGEYENGLKAIKWGTDYFIKCHTEPNVFWAQVGNGDEDHAFWGRPEDYTKDRPAFKIDANNPGSDLAGEVAATLAASSILFESEDPDYSNLLLEHAIELYEFANKFRGKYSDSVPNAASFYNSWSGYMDELALGAIWLYKATGDSKYLNDAEMHWNSMQKDPNELSWDNKGRAVAILLGEATDKSQYVDNANQFCSWLRDSAPKTPQGLVFLQQWGANRHAANVAFACLVASEYFDEDYSDFSRKQIHLLLGDAGRSYVVGYGNNPPVQPHHRSSSCPLAPLPCSWDQFNINAPNPQTLAGALVGGPKSQGGNYEDKRSDYISNEVALDYNAGFQSALAGLAMEQMDGICE